MHKIGGGCGHVQTMHLYEMATMWSRNVNRMGRQNKNLQRAVHLGDKFQIRRRIRYFDWKKKLNKPFDVAIYVDSIRWQYQLQMQMINLSYFGYVHLLFAYRVQMHTVYTFCVPHRTVSVCYWDFHCSILACDNCRVIIYCLRIH